MARSPRVMVTVSEKDLKRIKGLAAKFGMSESQLCRNLLKYGLDDLKIVDKLKITDVIGFVRRTSHSKGSKVSV